MPVILHDLATRSGLTTPVDPLCTVIIQAFQSPTGPPTEKNLCREDEEAGRLKIQARVDTLSPCRYALPAFLLYDAKGLQLFDAITHLEEYYLTQCEAEILAGPASRVTAEQVMPGTVIIELGCGSMRKTKHLLDAVEISATARARLFRNNPVRFYALDLDRGELEKSLMGLNASPPVAGGGLGVSNGWQHVTFHGLVGTYDQGISALKTIPELANAPSRLILWLGSSIGNQTRDEARAFLSQLQQNIHVDDRILLGVDGRNDCKDIELAYNDPKGVTREFELNILSHVNHQLSFLKSQDVFPMDAFDYAPVYNQRAGRHEAYLRVIRDVHIKNHPEFKLFLKRGELIHIENSYKYSQVDAQSLFNLSNLGVKYHWVDPSDKYSLYLLSPVPYNLHIVPSNLYSDVPTLYEWTQLWTAFDSISLKLVKSTAMHIRPINVRHPTCFYIGHLPCFADLQLSRLFETSPIGSELFQRIFERGIDPDLDNPLRCHPHSEVPDQWPDLEEVIDYRDRVREYIRTIVSRLHLQDFASPLDKNELVSTLSMIFEHDVMHYETLLYMVQQLPIDEIDTFAAHIPEYMKVTHIRTSLLPPPSTVQLPHTTVTLGRPRPDPKSLSAAPFGWDNEFPEFSTCSVGPLDVQTRPVSVSEYAAYLATFPVHKISELVVPSKWSYNTTEKSWQVRSIPHNGWLLVSTNEQAVGNWPVTVSQTMARSYIQWINSTGQQPKEWRLPTEHELRLILDRSGRCHEYSIGRLAPSDMQPCDSLLPAGNVWEWTSSVFKEHVGFVPHSAYPGYSRDFFDDKHVVVLGGSWATHPRLANRRSFRNWYQKGYPYAEIGFRLVRDCE